MAITIVETVGSASANSFASLADFTTYMEGRLNSDAFDDATTDEQNRALAEATRELSAVNWQGTRVDTTQALSWPRSWVTDPDDPNGNFYDSGEIPGRIKRATYELALAFLKAGTTDLASLDESVNVKQSTIDVLTTVYYEPGHRVKGLARFPAVMREIRPLMASAGITTQVVRG